MQVSAVLKGVHLSPQKARLVADLIRGKKVDNALSILTFTPTKGAEVIKKVVESAIANAEHNEGADIDELKVTSIYVDKGIVLRRIRARAPSRGRSADVAGPSSSGPVRAVRFDRRESSGRTRFRSRAGTAGELDLPAGRFHPVQAAER